MGRVRPACVLLLLVSAPTVDAAELRAELMPADHAIALGGGGEANLSYAWRASLVGTSCPSDAEFVVHFTIPELEWWSGMSFLPDFAAFRFVAGESIKQGSTTLEIRLAEDAPAPAETRIEFIPELSLVDAYKCTPQPTAQEVSAWLNLTVEAPASASASADAAADTGSSTKAPAISVATALLACLWVAIVRR